MCKTRHRRPRGSDLSLCRVLMACFILIEILSCRYLSNSSAAYAQLSTNCTVTCTKGRIDAAIRTVWARMADNQRVKGDQRNQSIASNNQVSIFYNKFLIIQCTFTFVSASHSIPITAATHLRIISATRVITNKTNNTCSVKWCSFG